VFMKVILFRRDQISASLGHRSNAVCAAKQMPDEPGEGVSTRPRLQDSAPRQLVSHSDSVSHQAAFCHLEFDRYTIKKQLRSERGQLESRISIEEEGMFFLKIMRSTLLVSAVMFCSSAYSANY